MPDPVDSDPHAEHPTGIDATAIDPNDLVLRIEDVHKSFGDKHILRGMSLEIARGETYVILGPSGSGKSVTLKHIVGLLQPDSGRVFIDRTEVTTASERDLYDIRGKIGYLFQSGALINWLSVRDNVALPLTEFTRLRDFEIDRRVDEYLEMVRMLPQKHQMPSELSGGQKRRVALARVLAGAPSIILYDEPTAGLDPIMSTTVAELIRSVQTQLGVTSILVTHDLPCAFAAGDRIAMFYGGSVAYEADTKTFQTSDHPIVRHFLSGGRIPLPEESS